MTEFERRRAPPSSTSSVRRGRAAHMALTVLYLVRSTLRLSAQVLLALIILFEEWGWGPLSRLAAFIARWRPIARLERGIAGLSPYPALAVFCVPSALLLPLKLAALWLIAHGHAFAAGALFLGAKVVGTALVARLYQLTEPALMQLGWFRRGYETLMPWKHALVAWVRASWAWRAGRVMKRRLGRALAPMAARLRELARPLALWLTARARR